MCVVKILSISVTFRLPFVILMTDTWHVKRCIIIIIIIIMPLNVAVTSIRLFLLCTKPD